MSKKRIRAGLAGFGISAKVFHLPFINALTDKYELVSILQRKGNEAQEKYPSVKIVRDIDELVDDPEIDLVVVTTPNDTHFPYAKKALEAGKHVVLEKPFTNTTREARELVNIAKHSGKALSVYQNRRYVSDFRTMKEILDKKLLGEIHEFEAHYDRYRMEARPAAWREAPLPGSGILYDLGPHIIDQALCFFGMPAAVTADIRMQRPHAKVDDYFILWLDYDFTKVILHAGMLVREPGPRYMIQGTRGSFIKYGEDPQEARLRAGELPVGEDWGMEPEEMFGLIHTEKEGKTIKEKYPSHKGSYADYYNELYESIVNGLPVKEKPEHGYNTIRIIELAIQSNNEKRTIDCTELMDVAY
ncbi:oxidoreductase [Agriterribacter sp.]|uniref:oxidoreductase n=1 Tax=Agriterribacter sp. TaxID=2821509 RepID=UPI002BA572FB|nr:oxidoreductase [Agriterribacter sp.]HRP55696.1 oxidoreductase [Agriterribacter sp.]